ncbi:MAG TPA: solute carrier family 23 protein [Thermoanaerobaculia bacterium]|nr:solute carrier family 23 protein [Thermoanaerobaculia bacterium]
MGVPTKPASLIYGVDDVPPRGAMLLLALQHVSVMSVGWIFVVVLVTAIGGTRAESGNVIRMSMIASGIATILQARVGGLVGSGYLCPFSCGPSYLAASILAGKAGGFPLIFGLTTVSGIFEGLFSRVVKRLRPLLPPEVTGLIVAMVGIELIALGCTRFLGYTVPGAPPDPRVVTVALVTLVAMVAPTVFGKGRIRLYPVVIGLLVGYGAAFALGLLAPGQLHGVLDGPIVGLPHRIPGGMAFDLALLGPFLIASLSSVLKTVGDLTLCQKVNDSEWKRTEMKSVSGGILAGSVGSTLAGLLGGVGQSTFSSNVGLSIATGATSRAVALPAGLLLIALAFLPTLAAVFAEMPAPVIGAMLVYVACFMILGGFQVVTSRMLDARRTFVVGIAFIFGLSVKIVPDAYAQVPLVLRPFFTSSLSLATVLVVLLNLLFRIGVSRKATLSLAPGADSHARISEFLERQGGMWGMRPEVVVRANEGLHELVVSIGRANVDPAIAVEARFDEFNLDLDVTWKGDMVALSDSAPTAESLRLKPESFLKLSGFLIRHYTDRVTTEQRGGRCRAVLHFDH